MDIRHISARLTEVTVVQITQESVVSRIHQYVDIEAVMSTLEVDPLTYVLSLDINFLRGKHCMNTSLSNIRKASRIGDRLACKFSCSPFL